MKEAMKQEVVTRFQKHGARDLIKWSEQGLCYCREMAESSPHSLKATAEAAGS